MCRAIKEEEQTALIFNLTNKIWLIITDLRNSLSSRRFQRFFILVSLICPFHYIRPDKRGAKIEKRCDWSNTLLHWVLFASIFFVPFKSYYHSDQFLQKGFGKFSCLHLAYPTRSLFITLTYCVLTNFHSEQLSLWHMILGKLSCLHIFFCPFQV